MGGAMLVSLVLGVILAAGGTSAAGPATGARALESLKTLVGEWEAVDPQLYGGKPIRLAYRLASNDTVLMETMSQVGDDRIDMLTIYYLDGDRLMLTHYCVMENQVRLVAEPDEGAPARVSFKFLDGTNVRGSSREHVIALTLALRDRDHLTQTWSWHVPSRSAGTGLAVYNYTRQK